MMKSFALLALPLLLTGCPQGASSSPGPTLGRALKVDEIRSDADQRLNAMIAKSGNDNRLFSVYQPSGISRWNQGWTRNFDLTGVAWNHTKSGTAITPRHIVYAAHYPHKIGTQLIFHQRNGKPHVRTLATTSGRLVLPSGWKTDIAIGLLDRPLPTSIKTYRLLPPRHDYSLALPGAPVLVTEQNRSLCIHQIRAIGSQSIGFARNPRVSELQYKNLIVGDSGNPSFLIVGGEPVLIETHTGGGAGSGPFYSDPEVFAALQNAVAQLDSSYAIRTVPLDPAPATKSASFIEPAPAKPAPSVIPPPKSMPAQPIAPAMQVPRVRRVPQP